MNTRFLETFVILAQLRSFRATAQALHATPAAISLRIKTLEEELQTELIDRNSKDFRLTANATRPGACRLRRTRIVQCAAACAWA
jgi:DNA-binding transcriptional LysR family regulator